MAQGSWRTTSWLSADNTTPEHVATLDLFDARSQGTRAGDIVCDIVVHVMRRGVLAMLRARHAEQPQLLRLL